MPNCYRCNIELLPKEKVNSGSINKKRFASREHIIPNFCGGHLKSNNLLCKKCNEILGTELESVLSKELIVSRLLPHNLDRKSQSNGFISGKTDISKTEVLIKRDLSWKFYKPVDYKLNL